MLEPRAPFSLGSNLAIHLLYMTAILMIASESFLSIWIPFLMAYPYLNTGVISFCCDEYIHVLDGVYSQERKVSGSRVLSWRIILLSMGTINCSSTVSI